MASFGGDVIEITFNGGGKSGVFFPKAGEGNTYDLGGVRTQDDNKSITSRGEAIWTQNNQMGFFQVLIANDMNVRQDLETLRDLAASLTEITWTFQIINGTKYRGTGMVVGDLTADIDKATVPLKVSAPSFKKI